MPSAGIATKTSGHAKGFPPSPLPRGTPPTPPFQKFRNVIEPLSGGLGGKPFAQHYSCPACFRCSVGLTVAASLGTIFVCESCLLAQWLVSHRTRQPEAALLSRPGRSHTRQAWHALSLWRRKKSRMQDLRHFEISKQATLKKWLLPFFLNAPPFP